MGQMYPKTPAGLLNCYVAAIPFFQNTLLSNLFYSALLFGGLAIAENRFAKLREFRRSPDGMQNAAMLWTGGKDCSLAFYEARRDGYEVRCLVTFAPANPNFLAHPPAFIKLQAQALALPHHILSINAPFDKSYEVALGRLRDEMGIETVITGDIAEVNGSPNWIRERSRPVGMKVHTPLWGRDRLDFASATTG